MVIPVKDEEEMLTLGKTVAGVLSAGDVVCLLGELGAGKTTLVRGIARGLGYPGRVTSPTFTLMNVYEGDIPLYHFDFFRLQGCDIEDLGMEEYLERDGVCFIEWPAIGQAALPQEALEIRIELLNDDYDQGRMVAITGQGPYGKKVEELERLVSSGH